MRQAPLTFSCTHLLWESRGQESMHYIKVKITSFLPHICKEVQWSPWQVEQHCSGNQQKSLDSILLSFCPGTGLGGGRSVYAKLRKACSMCKRPCPARNHSFLLCCFSLLACFKGMLCFKATLTAGVTWLVLPWTLPRRLGPSARQILPCGCGASRTG